MNKTNLSSHLVVVQVHQVADVPRALVVDRLRRVHKRLAEPQPVLDVVAAPTPLPPLDVSLPVPRHVARAVRQVPGRTRPRDRVHDAS